MNSENFQSWIK